MVLVEVSGAVSVGGTAPARVADAFGVGFATCGARKLIQSRWPMPISARELAGVDQVPLCERLPSKVRGIDGFAENRLTHGTQLREGELSPEKAVGDGGVLSFAAKPIECIRNNFAVIKGQLRQGIC